MSLQGTLDTFPLPDVLRLLASTRKTGHLRLQGSRGVGGLWFTGGSVAAIAPPRDAGTDPRSPAAEVLCEVLRCPDGTFAFEADGASPLDGETADLGSLLDEAEELLVEWRALAEVVPSLACGLALRPELEDEAVTVSPEHWRLVVAVGGGTTVAALGDALGMGELAVSRAVKGLVEAGLADVGPASVTEAHEQPEQPEQPEPQAEPEPTPVPPAVDGFVRRPLGARPGPRGPGLGVPLSASLGELASLGGARRPHPGGDRPEGDDEEQAEVARRLADLGPDTAAKVAAAAGAATPEERDAALDAIEAEVDGQPVNRSALLKFLSSVRS